MLRWITIKMLNKFKRTLKNSAKQDFASNKATLFLAIFFPVLVLQSSPNDMFTFVLWWSAIIILFITILYVIYGIYVKFFNKH